MRKQPIIISFVVLMLVFALACGDWSTASKEQAGDAGKAEIPPSSAQWLQVVEIATKGDTLNYDRDTLSVNATRDVTVKFHNAASSLQHNWVLVQPGSKDAIATAGIEAGEVNSWLPPSDPRVIAFIKLLDGGDRGEANFKAPPAGVYQYVCTFPGHNFTMYGDFVVS